MNCVVTVDKAVFDRVQDARQRGTLVLDDTEERGVKEGIGILRILRIWRWKRGAAEPGGEE